MPDAPQPPQPFYRALIQHLWSQPRVQTPQELALWMSNTQFSDPLQDLGVWVGRLMAWPPDRPYPPIPDDDALANGSNPPDRRWWVPGATPVAPNQRAPRSLSTA